MNRSSGLRAILVSVDYADLLAITLPYNRHHFSEITVVTVGGSEDAKVAAANGANLYITDAFYRGGAEFNKWAALEEGLDVMGREGWICLMDADVLWPKELSHYAPAQPNACELVLGGCALLRGGLYSPLRRMFEGVGAMAMVASGAIPPETEWTRYPIHRNIGEWAGYTQIFHATDPVLGPPPWHQVDWRHAGGADSFFQAKWSRERRMRPGFEVLHLGAAGVNWCGRTARYLDGTEPPEAELRRGKLARYWEGRRGKGTGVYDQDKYRHEKLS